MARAATSWPFATGEAAERIRRYDWATTPLDPIEDWSDRLRLAVELMLDTRSVASLVCGRSRLLLYNDAAARLYGPHHPHAFALPLPQAFPNGWRVVASFYERAFAGEAIRLSEQPLDTRGEGGRGDVFDAWLTPVREADGQVAAVLMIGAEVGERVRSGATMAGTASRQDFLLRLADTLRPLAEAAAVRRAACTLLAEELGTDRAYYVEVDEEAGVATVEEDYVRGDHPSLAGRHPVSAFAWSVAILRQRRCHVVDDARTSPVVPDADRAASIALQIIACMGAPVIKEGRLVGAVCVTSSTPRDWTDAEVALLRDVAERIWSAIQRARAEEAVRAVERRRQVLVTELQHRTFNLMGVIRSMAAATVRTSAGLADFHARFDDRLEALARTQRLLSRRAEGGRLTFDQLLRDEFAAVGALDHPAVRLHGPTDVALRSAMVQTLAMAMHELTTNALKYGALAQDETRPDGARPDGARLDVAWRLDVDDDGRSWLAIDWRERGVTLAPRGRAAGQGRTLIEEALPYQLGARTTFALGDDGVHCTIALPIPGEAA